MKQYTKLVLFVFALISAQTLSAQCNASFTASGNGATFTFSAVSTPATSSIIGYDFGDGNYAYTPNASHTYTANGNYVVTFSVIDSLLMCSDIQTDTVTVTGIGVNCNASFSYMDSANTGVFSFWPDTTIMGSTYNWVIDGAIYTSANVTHTFNNPGTYYACLEVSNSALGCSDSACVSITVSSGGVTCDASFTVSNVAQAFTFTPNYPDASASYVWHFGDGNSSTMSNPTHTYTASGTYSVSVARMIPSLCVDSAFTTVTVSIINPPVSGIISGGVFMGNNYADHGVVFLISNDSNGFLQAIDTASIDSGMYYFSNVAYGSYLVKAALSPTSINYSSYLPTYYATPVTSTNPNGELLWSDASNIVLNSSYSNNNEIALVAGTNTGGPGFIGGLVSQGANKVGDPISDIHILITDDNGAPIAYAYSDNTGSFNIDNLPYGTYIVYPEVAGKATTPLTITLNATNPNTDQIRVEVNSTTVSTSIATGIENNISFSGVSVYPNPINEVLNVNLGTDIAGKVSIRITEITGKVIYQEVTNNASRIEINTSNFKGGMYILSLENEGKSAFYKIIK